MGKATEKVMGELARFGAMFKESDPIQMYIHSVFSGLYRFL
jgi:hypothetical protein